MDYRDTRAYILDPCIQEFRLLRIMILVILATKPENIVLTATIESCQNKTNLIGKKMSGKNRVFKEKNKKNGK